ncbi:MAG: DNA-3-methyladenine glycosylase [Patescibacteria group bacterium]
MRKALSAGFFDKPTVSVARSLLGKFLVCKVPPTRGRSGRRSHVIAAMITEVEAYDGFRDKASHAARGKTKRNTPMFGQPGYWYVYFTYGIHWMLNVVTGKVGYPAAVLIRGLHGINGPARLTKKLNVDGRFNNLPANRKTGLWIEDRGYKLRNGKIYPPSPRLRKGDSPGRRIKKSPRVGVSYAGKYWAGRHYRFSIKESSSA